MQEFLTGATRMAAQMPPGAFVSNCATIALYPIDRVGIAL